MSEGKYVCLKHPEELYFLSEIPPNCIKGFKEYQMPKPAKEYDEKPKHKCKIYKFKKEK